MAKLKLSLTPNPTFKATVNIPVPGAQPAPVEFTFRGRGREQFREFIDGLKDQDDADAVMGAACGWDLDEPFDREHVGQMIDGYLGAAREILDTYMRELTAARRGN